MNVVEIEQEQAVFKAMTPLKADRGSFDDALIGELGTQSGCVHTLTFDPKALRLERFVQA